MQKAIGRNNSRVHVSIGLVDVSAHQAFRTETFDSKFKYVFAARGETTARDAGCLWLQMHQSGSALPRDVLIAYPGAMGRFLKEAESLFA